MWIEKRKNKRLLLLLTGIIALAAAVALVLTTFTENIVFFYSPTEIVQKKPNSKVRLRIGGLVESGSLARKKGDSEIQFNITDLTTAISVRFNGILPDLFREDQGVIAEGKLRDKNYFIADQILAKHDENYMPPEVSEALKKSNY